MMDLNAIATAVEPWDDEAAPRALAWMPGPGESRVGTFQRWTARTDSNGENHAVALFDGDDGQRYSIWCCTVVLKKAMDRANPQAGDSIRISRLADRTSARGRSYRVHRVVILNRAAHSTGNSSPGADLESEGGER